MVINATVGAGIFGVPGRVYGLVGIWGVPLCLLGGLLMALVAACFAQAGSRFTRSGGPYLFVHQAFGPGLGFAMGWLSVASRLFTFAAIANLATGYAGAIWPPIAAGSGRAGAISLLAVGLAAPIYRGVALSARVSTMFTLCKLTLLLGFIVLAVPPLWRHGIVIGRLPPASHWAPALLLLLFALTGLEAAAISNGDMRAPARDIPVALAAGISAVVLFYSAVFLASVALVPNLAQSARPLFDGATSAIGAQGGALAAAGGVISMLGVLFVVLFNTPREIQALAVNGQLPAAFARAHPRFNTPANALAAFTLGCWALALSASFQGAAAAATLTRLIMYSATAAAAIALRRRGFSETAVPVALPAGAAIPVAVLTLCGIVIAHATVAEFGVLALTLLPGLLMAALFRRSTRSVIE